MRFYGKITSVEDGDFLIVTVDIYTSKDKVRVASDIRVLVPHGNYCEIRDICFNVLAKWVTANIFKGDEVAAIRDEIESYTDADWEKFGI